MLLYKFTAFISLDSEPGRLVVGSAVKRFSNFDEAQIFARGFAWGVYQVRQQPIEVAFRAAGSKVTSWAFCPIF